MTHGLLLVDKPRGLTSHDVVARVRRVLQQPSVGHTGTLDPMATGLLVIVAGSATRLASLLVGHDKTYDAVIRLGRATTTDDALGEFLGKPLARPTEAAVREAIEAFRGTFAQTPPAHSAKKIAGRRAYTLARQKREVRLEPVDVTVKDLSWQALDEDDLAIRVRVTSGFYVRALARDLGARLGCGGHLVGLRRLTSGPFRIDDALPLERIEAGAALDRALIAPADALPDLDRVELTADGLRRIRHGATVGPAHIVGGPGGTGHTQTVRVVADGALVALARRHEDTLHPVAVLG